MTVWAVIWFLGFELTPRVSLKADAQPTWSLGGRAISMSANFNVSRQAVKYMLSSFQERKVAEVEQNAYFQFDKINLESKYGESKYTNNSAEISVSPAFGRANAKNQLHVSYLSVHTLAYMSSNNCHTLVTY